MITVTGRKYTDIRVLTEVYCSSSCNYEFHCVCNYGRFAYYPATDPPAMVEKKRGWTDWFAPQYVCREVKRQIVEMFNKGQLKVYEQDRDGNKRYAELRYHEPELFKSWIESWKVEQS